MIEIVDRAPTPPTLSDLDIVAVVPLHHPRRVLLPLTVAAGVVVLDWSDHDSQTSSSDSTVGTSSGTLDELRTDARRYAEAFLRGTAEEINAWHSSSCADAITPDELVRVRAGIQQAIGAPADTIGITGTQVRDLGGGRAQVSVTTDLPPAQEGNDNWIDYQLEAGDWRVVDCTMLPFGGHSTSSSPSATTPGSSSATDMAAVIGVDWSLCGDIHFRLNPTGHFIEVVRSTCFVLGDYTVTGSAVRFTLAAAPYPNCPDSATASGSWARAMASGGGEFVTSADGAGVLVVRLRMVDTGETITLQPVTAT